jgi:Type II CAAX prenyl endopeptidase Rce1-like
MSTLTSTGELALKKTPASWQRWGTAAEVTGLYAAILLYIWRWESVGHWAWTILLGCVIASHILHRDKPSDLGLTFTFMRRSAEVALPLAASILVPVVVYAFLTHRFVIPTLGSRTPFYFLGYGIWCAVQQYAMQCYFHYRLRSVIRNPHLSSALVALMFGGAHLPNMVLVVVTMAGGFLLSEIYARYPNIWPLAMAQAVGGFLVAALTPAALIHNMRVGPGYYRYHLR